MHEVLVNHLGGLSLPRKSVVRLTDRPDMTLDVYRGRKTTTQQQGLGREYTKFRILPPLIKENGIASLDFEYPLTCLLLLKKRISSPLKAALLLKVHIDPFMIKADSSMSAQSLFHGYIFRGSNSAIYILPPFTTSNQKESIIGFRCRPRNPNPRING